jgi:hypothetical protein
MGAEHSRERAGEQAVHALDMMKEGAPWHLPFLWQVIDALPRDKEWYKEHGGIRGMIFPKG